MLDHIRGRIVVSISARHAEDPGSIPGRGGARAIVTVVGRVHLPAMLLYGVAKPPCQLVHAGC